MQDIYSTVNKAGKMYRLNTPLSCLNEHYIYTGDVNVGPFII